MQVLSPTYEYFTRSVATNPKEVTDRPPGIISFAISLTSPIAVDVCQRIAPDDLGDHDGRLAKGVLFADWAPSLIIDPSHGHSAIKVSCHLSTFQTIRNMMEITIRTNVTDRSTALMWECGN